MRLSPRVFIYPIVILAICYCMSKNKTLQKGAETQEAALAAPVQALDPNKPTALIAADAPVFPQLIFYYNDTLPFQATVDKLNDKFHRLCTIAAVNLNTAPNLKEKFHDAKTPFAVFSKPDGTNITIQDITDFDFFDLMLTSQLQTPQAQQPETSAPSK